MASFQLVYPLVRDASLLEYYVREVARADILVNGKPSAVDGAEPDFVIAFALPVESASVPPQDFLQATGVARHYAACGS